MYVPLEVITTLHSGLCMYMLCIFIYIPFSRMYFEVDREKGLKFSEIADGVSVEDVKAAIGCSFQVRLYSNGVSSL